LRVRWLCWQRSLWSRFSDAAGPACHTAQCALSRRGREDEGPHRAMGYYQTSAGILELLDRFFLGDGGRF